MNTLRDALVRAFGARPGTFIPFLRAYGLMARRRSRLRESRLVRAKSLPASWISPFHFTCLMTLFLGVYTVSALLDRSEILSGSILAATLGFAFVGSIALFDYFDLFFSPEEFRVLGAHPHHPWSIMLAKLFVIGRAIVTLALCFFLPGILTIAFVTRDAVLVAAFASGTLLGAIATGAVSVVLGSTILSIGGRSALLRFLPWVQTGYLILYFSIVAGRQVLLDTVQNGLDGSASALWLLPSAWFVAPVEWAMGKANPGTAGRGLLALGSLLAVAAIGTRSVGAGFGERMLLSSSSTKRAPAAARRHRAASPAPRATTRPAARAFARIAAAHARTDLSFRGQLVMAIVWPLLLFGSQVVGGVNSGQLARPNAFVLLGFAVPLSMGLWAGQSAFTISSRPGAIACVLTAPVDRVRFAMAPVSLLRRWALLPVVAGIGAWYLGTAPAGDQGARSGYLLGLALLLETQLVVNRAVAPGFPFSAAVSRDRRFAWGQVLAFFIGLGFTILGIGLLALCWWVGGWAIVGGAAALALLRLAAGYWAKRRVQRAAASFEAL